MIMIFDNSDDKREISHRVLTAIAVHVFVWQDSDVRRWNNWIWVNKFDWWWSMNRRWRVINCQL